jgi:hypothetical protein
MNADQAKTLEEHDILLLGRNGEPGLAHKVQFMWRAHVWVLCGLSGCLGYAVHFVVMKVGM